MRERERGVYEISFGGWFKHLQKMQEAGVPTLNESAQNSHCANAGRVDCLPETSISALLKELVELAECDSGLLPRSGSARC